MTSQETLAVAPYQEILTSLVASIMAAQADLLEVYGPHPKLGDNEHNLVNRHFAWLTNEYSEGVNRHLFEQVEGTFPLRTKPLRSFKDLPEDLKDIIIRRAPIPNESDLYLQDSIREYLDSKGLRRLGPTRISRLVISSFERRTGRYKESDVYLRSLLSIAYDFLTDPTMLSSRSYALLSIRNHIFEAFNLFPDDIETLHPRNGFTVPQLEVALSHIATSFRERWNSKGLDPIPSEGRSRVGGVLRAFLAARNILWMRFTSVDDCITYLRNGVIRSSAVAFEYARPEQLERLPELGEIVNELWGVPIPIRGADTLFRGGLKFSSRQGLIMGIHGGAGSGKTSLALAISCVLAPFGIRTLYLTAEETSEDLRAKTLSLIPDELRRLSFFPKDFENWVTIQRLASPSEIAQSDMLTILEREFERLSSALNVNVKPNADFPGPPMTCRAVIVLDGIHDLLMSTDIADDSPSKAKLINRLRDFILACRDLKALVILTAGNDWAGSHAFDYLVDVALSLTHDSVHEYGRRPDRNLTLTKARHQLCAVGTHGIQIGGSKGVRLSPQINYQLDRRAIWRTRLPDMEVTKRTLSHVWTSNYQRDISRLEAHHTISRKPSTAGVSVFRGANIFLNGEGSGAKAALAMKIAISPCFNVNGDVIDEQEKILVVSFLYPKEYYDNITEKLLTLRHAEYGERVCGQKPNHDVIHLYPGNYRADQLFNRIEWMLDAADLNGDPYTCIIIDGLHNVFLQFPEIESYKLFWPQVYSSLRARPVTIISTHTTFVLQGVKEGEEYRLDDKRSEPLRHSLVQKTDFRFEIDPVGSRGGIGGRRREVHDSNVFSVKTVAAINQPIPDRDLLWSRESLILFDPPQGELDF